MENENTNTVTTPATVAVVETPDTITGTIKEISERLGVDALNTRGALLFLAAQGQCKTVGKREIPNKRGKPSVLYQLNTKIVLDLTKKS